MNNFRLLYDGSFAHSLTDLSSSVSDPLFFFTDPDPDPDPTQKPKADPDPDLDPDPDPGEIFHAYNKK